METTGFFWLPEDQETRLPGVLSISEGSAITVQLAGVFGNPLSILSNMGVTVTPALQDEEPSLERINGIVEKGGRITLDRCLRQGASFGLPGGLSKSTVHAALAYIGAEYGKEEEVLFSEVSFGVEGLDTWLFISGIEPEPDIANNRGLIRYRIPEEILIALSNGVELKFAFSLTSPGVSLPITEVAVKQTAFVCVKSNQPQPIEFFSSLAFKLCNFISLALDQDVCMESMTGYLDHKVADGQERRVPIRVYGQFAPWTEKKPIIRWHDALFRYPDVTDRASEMVVKWFENYEVFDPALNLYFASRTQTAVFLDTKVLWLAQALETFHRKSSQETEMSEDEFRNLIDLVIESCPDDKRDWVHDSLRYANELRFRRRLRRLIEPFRQWFGVNSREREAFINTVCDTRNYLTHYEEATTKNRAAEPEELFVLHEKMEALFQLHLLMLIGLDEPSIDSLIQNNSRIRRKLGS